MFNYMLSFEIADFFLALIACLVGIFRCGALCNFGYQYITKVLELIFYTYLANTLQIFQTFLEITFALERIQTFSTKGTKNQMRFHYQVIIMITVAVIVTLPNFLVTRSIVPIGILSGTDQVLHQIGISNFAQKGYWTIFLFVLVLIGSLFLYIVIFILNIIAIYRYKKFMFKK